MCFLGLLGVVLMIIENEITFINGNEADLLMNWAIKLLITMSTVTLVALVFYYHRLDLTLYSVNNALDNWRLNLTTSKVFSILAEVLICAIHPIPQLFTLDYSFQQDNSTVSNTPRETAVSVHHIDIDVALGLPSK